MVADFIKECNPRMQWRETPRKMEVTISYNLIIDISDLLRAVGEIKLSKYLFL
jgi:hypothetical protein